MAPSNLPGHPVCGATTREGTPCARVAGWGTDHKGQGRCSWHGGASLIRSGRYSKIKRKRVADLIEAFEADPEPLNVLSELALARALMVDFIERYDEYTEALIAWHESWGDEDANPNPKPRQVLDVSDAVRHADTISKIVERVEKVRAAFAISVKDYYRLVEQVGLIIAAEADEPTAERIRRRILELRL